MSNLNIDQNRHESPTFTYKIAGVAQDISLAALTFVLFANETTTTATFTKKNVAAGGADAQISWVTDGTNGEYQVHILPADTVSLSLTTTYHWEIKMTLAGKDTTPGDGTLTLRRCQIT